MHIFFHAQLQQKIIDGIYCGRPKWIWSLTLHSLRAEKFSLSLSTKNFNPKMASGYLHTYVLQEQHKNKVLEKFLVVLVTPKVQSKKL